MRETRQKPVVTDTYRGIVVSSKYKGQGDNVPYQKIWYSETKRKNLKLKD